MALMVRETVTELQTISVLCRGMNSMVQETNLW
jgi:hypothetical protein